MKNLTPYSAGYSDVDVSIVDYDKNIARHAWNCYRMTWRELQDVEYDVNDKRVREEPSDRTRKLIIQGSCVFGGGEIR